jgi:alginate O-acetyltransferase complex protein AlgI
MTTMLLGGLWHGASWAFVVWGGLHGLYLSVERVLKRRFTAYRPGPLALIALGLLTYALINVTWVFFRAKGFGKAWTVLRGMFGFNADAKPILPTVHLVAVVAIVGAILFAHWLMRARTLEDAIARTPAPMVSAIWAVMAFAIVIAQGTGNAFIYFQF